MDINTNKNLHSTILQSVAALREYDKVKHWDEGSQDEVKKLLTKMEIAIQQEKLYYSMYRDIKIL